MSRRDLRRKARRAADAINQRRDGTLERAEQMDMKRLDDAELLAIIAASKRLQADPDDAAALGTLDTITAGITGRTSIWLPGAHFSAEAVREATETAAARLGLRGKPTPAVLDVTEPPEPPRFEIVPRRPEGDGSISPRAWTSAKTRSKWSLTRNLQDEIF